MMVCFCEGVIIMDVKLSDEGLWYKQSEYCLAHDFEGYDIDGSAVSRNQFFTLYELPDIAKSDELAGFGRLRTKLMSTNPYHGEGSLTETYYEFNRETFEDISKFVSENALADDDIGGVDQEELEEHLWNAGFLERAILPLENDNGVLMCHRFEKDAFETMRDNFMFMIGSTLTHKLFEDDKKSKFKEGDFNLPIVEDDVPEQDDFDLSL